MSIDRNPDDAAARAAVEHAAVVSIGQAQGVIAELYDLSLDSALGVLDRKAHDAGIPLVEAARWLLTTETLP
ncbi:ANTAR domain-containing protein [Kribbella swartbergensis]